MDKSLRKRDTTPNIRTPLYYGDPFASLGEGNPGGNYNTFNKAILPGSTWGNAVSGAMKRQKLTKSKVQKRL